MAKAFFRRRAGRISVLTLSTTGPSKLVCRSIGLGEALAAAVGLLDALLRKLVGKVSWWQLAKQSNSANEPMG